MNKLIKLIGTFVLFLFINCHSISAQNVCNGVISSSKFVEGCNKELHVYLTNNSNNYTLDLWFALLKEDGTWDAGLEWNVSIGKRIMYWGCNCTGTWFYMCRIADSDFKFPQSQADIWREYNKTKSSSNLIDY